MQAQHGYVLTPPLLPTRHQSAENTVPANHPLHRRQRASHEQGKPKTDGTCRESQGPTDPASADNRPKQRRQPSGQPNGPQPYRFYHRPSCQVEAHSRKRLFSNRRLAEPLISMLTIAASEVEIRCEWGSEKGALSERGAPFPVSGPCRPTDAQGFSNS